MLATDCYFVHILPFERNMMFLEPIEVTEQECSLSAVFLLYWNAKIPTENYNYKQHNFWACTALLTPSICVLPHAASSLSYFLHIQQEQQQQTRTDWLYQFVPLGHEPNNKHFLRDCMNAQRKLRPVCAIWLAFLVHLKGTICTKYLGRFSGGN